MAGSTNDLINQFLQGVVDGTVTLNGGIPATIPGSQQVTSLSDTNVVTSPGAGAVLATVTVPSNGVYNVEVNSFIGGTTVAANEINNMRLRVNAVAVGRIVNPVPGTTGATSNGRKSARIAATTGQVIDVIAVNAGTVGAIYAADLVASRM